MSLIVVMYFNGVVLSYDVPSYLCGGCSRKTTKWLDSFFCLCVQYVPKMKKTVSNMNGIT